jgi:hypothetical protein
MPKVGADAAQIGLADAGWLVLARADDGIPFRMVAFTKSADQDGYTAASMAVSREAGEVAARFRQAISESSTSFVPPVNKHGRDEPGHDRRGGSDVTGI